MAIGSSPTGFPKILILLGGAGGVFVGLFSFIFSCILVSPANIILSMMLTAAGILFILTGVHILSVLQTNIPMMITHAIYSILNAFIQLVIYSRLASAYGIVASIYNQQAKDYYAVSIVLSLLMAAVIVFYTILCVVLWKYHESTVLTSTSTTVTSSSRTVTSTTIETPPANYPNATAPYVT